MSEPDPRGSVPAAEPPPQLNPTAHLRVLTPAEATARLVELRPPAPTPAQGSAPMPAPVSPPARRGWTGYAVVVFVVALVALVAVIVRRG